MTYRETFIWRTMCRIRYFSVYAHQAIVDGRVKCFTYLSAGQEAAPAAVAWAFQSKRVNVFCQHRNHGAYIAFGGDVTKLRDELLGERTGTTGGIGGDPMHHFRNDRVWMVGHSGLVADQIPIGVGMALATGEQSIIFMGDAAPEEDVFGPAIGFASSKALPVLFVCEDNNLSVITAVSLRRNWSAALVAQGYNIVASMTNDNPFVIEALLSNGRGEVGFIEIACQRMYRHVGAGQDRPMKYDCLHETRNYLLEKYKGIFLDGIEGDAKEEMSALWK